ncbi:MAG TPA: hypothetical protein VG712_01345, partial [Gemmatimonadales bacterium]|nr:hypothetical protein [Gemmatimonadales bacterium]
ADTMNDLLRRIRAAVVIGALWAGVWFAVGMVLLLIVGLGAADVPFPLFFGFLGFLAGAIFSGALGLIERRRSFGQLSLPRIAGWGGLGGILLAGLVALIAGPGAELLVVVPVFALAGAGSAAGTLALAHAASAPQQVGPGLE